MRDSMMPSRIMRIAGPLVRRRYWIWPQWPQAAPALLKHL